MANKENVATGLEQRDGMHILHKAAAPSSSTHTPRDVCSSARRSQYARIIPTTERAFRTSWSVRAYAALKLTPDGLLYS